MTRDDLLALVLTWHPNQAAVLAAATQVLEYLPEPGDDEVLAVGWALDSTIRWARGEAELDEVLAASSAAGGAAANDPAISAAAAIDYDRGASAVAAAYYYGEPGLASAEAAYAELAARFPRKGGRWGPWRQGRLIARAGDYLWRESEGRFVERSELTPEESVDLDEIEERWGGHERTGRL